MAARDEVWDGGLTVSAGKDGEDSYDFGARAALAPISTQEVRGNFQANS
jgi:hypothetical protein